LRRKADESKRSQSSGNTKTLEHLLEPRVRLQGVKLWANREPESYILTTLLVGLFQGLDRFLSLPQMHVNDSKANPATAALVRRDEV
jgi:hypothetical protein